MLRMLVCPVDDINPMIPALPHFHCSRFHYYSKTGNESVENEL
jgi:hypothetical protein